MPRGLGKSQRQIKAVLQRAFDADIGPLTFATIRQVVIVSSGGDPERDRLTFTHERSLKRSIKALVDRGDAVIVGGKGRLGDAYRYTTIEAFASATGEKVKDTAHPKQIVAELASAVLNSKL